MLAEEAVVILEGPIPSCMMRQPAIVDSTC